MQTQYINEMLNLPELKIHQIPSIDANELHLEAFPVHDKQCCPCCGSDQDVIRKGRNDRRRVRHLSVFEKKTYLHVPSIRMYCTRCEAGFVWAHVSDPSSATASFSAPMPSNKPSVRQPSIAPVCSRRRPAPYSVSITKRFRLNVNGSMNKYGKKRKKLLIWFWVSTILRARKVVPTTKVALFVKTDFQKN